MFRFHIVIDGNPPSPQLFLPMDRYEAEQVLYDLGLDGPSAVHAIEMYSDNSGIHIVPGKDLRALNRLARQIDQMDDYQRAAFRAWGTTQGVCSVENALKACCHMDMLEFHPGFDSDELLGEFALDNDIFAEYKDLPDDTFAMLDRAKVGARMREMDGGVLANGGYLVAGDVAGEELPAEEPLPWFQVSFSEGWVRESVWYSLPMTAEDEREIAGLFETDSLDGLNMGCRSSIPQLSGITPEADELPGLRLLHEALNGMSGEEIQKYKALIEVAKPESVGEAFRLADNLDHYDIELEYADPAAYGRQYLEDCYHFNEHDYLLSFIDYEGFGAAMMQQDSYMATRYGAVYMNVMAQSILAGPNTLCGIAYSCGRTEGFPTFVCWDPDQQNAWLELGVSAADSELASNFSYYQKICEDWGMRHCASVEDYAQIVSDLGAQPYDEVMAEEQSFGGMGGMT